jgi:rsbT co-antagonist protein RsbR
MKRKQPQQASGTDELTRLRQQVAELEQTVAHLTAERDTAATSDVTEQLALFKALADNAPDAIAVANMDGIIIYANPAYRTLFNFDQGALGMSILDTLAPEEHERFPAIIKNVTTEGIWRDNLLYQRTDGSRFTGQVSGFTITDHTGQIRWTAAIIRDISVQVQQERELRIFFALAENAPDCIAQVNLEGTITYANPAFQRITGYGPAMIGMHTAQFHDDPPERLEEIAREVAEQDLWQGEMVYRRKDGSIFLAHSSSFAVRDSDGSLLTIAGIARDLTEQHRAEEERMALQEQMIEVQRATLRELSTPLIPLADEVVAMPLIGTIDSGRAQQILETLLEGVAEHQAEVVILDITGVQMVDTQVASALVRAAQAVKLLGARVVLTGIRPEVAQTLVGMGADLGDIVTLSNLQSGIAYVLQQNGYMTEQ